MAHFLKKTVSAPAVGEHQFIHQVMLCISCTYKDQDISSAYSVASNMSSYSIKIGNIWSSMMRCHYVVVISNLYLGNCSTRFRTYALVNEGLIERRLI